MYHKVLKAGETTNADKYCERFDKLKNPGFENFCFVVKGRLWGWNFWVFYLSLFRGRVKSFHVNNVAVGCGFNGLRKSEFRSSMFIRMGVAFFIN